MPWLWQVHLFLHEIGVAIHLLDLSNHSEGIQSLQHVYPLSFLHGLRVSQLFDTVLVNVHELLILVTHLNRALVLLCRFA